MKKSNTKPKLHLILEFSKREPVPVIPIKWIVFRNGDAFATPALTLLLDKYHFKN